MREVVFALRFTGHGGPVPGSTTKRQARTVAPSQAWRTVIAPTGVSGLMEPVPGESAVLESRVERFADGSFVEDGTIIYGSAGAITFDTVGRGHVGPAPLAGWSHGVVMWRITAGEGHFTGAQGLITSNFTVSPNGEVTDDHVARLYLRQ